jgi:hypothetical protein
MARCWFNPEARGCKTCKHFELPESPDWETGYGGSDEGCAEGVDLTGRPACPGCGGFGWADTNTGAQKPCGPHLTDLHVGDGTEVKPGPIVHCEKWEAQS